MPYVCILGWPYIISHIGANHVTSVIVRAGTSSYEKASRRQSVLERDKKTSREFLTRGKRYAATDCRSVRWIAARIGDRYTGGGPTVVVGLHGVGIRTAEGRIVLIARDVGA